MIKSWAPLIVLGLLLLISGCAEQPVAPPPVPPPDVAKEARLRLEAGEKAWQSGRLEDAGTIFADFLRRFPNQPGADLAWLRHAQIQLAQGFPSGARRSFEQVLKTYPHSRLIPQARLGLAEALVRDKKPQRAVIVLAESDPAGLEGADLLNYYDILAQARFGLNQPKAALVLLVQGHQRVDSDLRSVLEERLTGFVDLWPPKTLEELLGLYPSAFPAAWILSGLAAKSVEASDWHQALFYRQELIRRFPDHPLAQKANEAQSWARLAAEKGAVTLGALLPLSGPLAAHGQKLLEGIQLAAGAFEPDSPFRLVIEDTADDPLITAAALERLTLQEDALAVVGPLSARLAAEAAAKAEELKIPLITLTQSPQVARDRMWVMRNFITPSLLIEALAQRAVVDLALIRMAILHPDSPYGQRTADQFTEQVEKLGGRVVKRVSYPPGLADLAEKLFALGGQEPDEPPREEPPGFDALFLPDDFRQVAQIAPQLAFYDLKPSVLLGTNLWHDEELIELVGPYVQGAIIPTTFFADSEEPAVRDFVAQFGRTYGHPPNLFNALGYDAVKLIVDIFSSRAPESRRELLNSLLKTHHYPGVTGETYVNQDGEAIKKPYLLTVKGRRFVLAPTEPQPTAD